MRCPQRVRSSKPNRLCAGSSAVVAAGVGGETVVVGSGAGAGATSGAWAGTQAGQAASSTASHGAAARAGGRGRKAGGRTAGSGPRIGTAARGTAVGLTGSF